MLKTMERSPKQILLNASKALDVRISAMAIVIMLLYDLDMGKLSRTSMTIITALFT